MNCNRCDTPLPKGKYFCPSCKHFNHESSSEAQDESILLEDIVSAEVDRLITGPWDKCFGVPVLADDTEGIPGIVRGSTNLIAGSPGAGKSSMFLQMSENVINTYDTGDVLYLSAEEILPQIKARADRFKLKTKKRLRFLDLRQGSPNIGNVLESRDFILLIVDSLKALVGDDELMAIEVCKIIKQYAEKKHAPAVISQHVTKDEAIAGLMRLQHEVDMTAHFFPDNERINPETNEPLRVLETQKNRNGRAFIEALFEMTSRGLKVIDLQDEDWEDESE